MTEYIGIDQLRRSNAIIDKIKLFEGAPSPLSPRVPSPVGVKRMSLNRGILNSLADGKLWRKSMKEDVINNKESPKIFSIEVREEEDLKSFATPSLSPRIHTPKTAVPAINTTLAIELSQREERGPEQDSKGKIKSSTEEKRIDIVTSGELKNGDITKDPQSSPRPKNKDKIIKLREPDDIDDDTIKLNKLSAEDKEMIRKLVKATKRKNKAISGLEETFSRERQLLLSQFESEKEAWLKELQTEQRTSTEKDEKLKNEEAKNLNLTTRLRKAQEDLQQTQATLAQFKRILDEYKKNTDTELYNKSQSLMSVSKQLGTLCRLRDSLECVICEERVAKVVLNPCHHLVLCSHCAPLVSQCPMCRSSITSKYEVYTNWQTS